MPIHTRLTYLGIILLLSERVTYFSTRSRRVQENDGHDFEV